jgi:hypothetical protein
MKTWLGFSTFALLFGALAGAQIVRADTAAANCEVRKDGEKQGGKSGPCTFGQRQGHIDIDLRNGSTFSLSPGNNANHYRDQKGNKVVRTSSTANSQEFRWENGKYVTVRFNHSGHNNDHNQSYGAAGASGSEYQRGYKDGQRGTWDQNKHNQEYKDGYRAGEQAGGGSNSGGNGGGNSADGSYYINPLNNGGFEVVWSKHGCVATFTRQGDPLVDSNGYTNSQTHRSDDIAKRRFSLWPAIAVLSPAGRSERASAPIARCVSKARICAAGPANSRRFDYRINL